MLGDCALAHDQCIGKGAVRQPLGNQRSDFALASNDRNWGEVGGAVRYDTDNISFDLGIDSTIGRGDLDYRSIRGGVTFHF